MLLGGIASRLEHANLFFSRLPFIDEIVIDNLDAPSMTYQSVFTVRNSDRAFENITGIAGLGLFNQVAEGNALTYDSMKEAYSKTFTHLDYALGTQLTKQAMRDDIDRAIVNTEPHLAKSARVSIETTTWNALNNGFTGGGETTPDGQPVFSNSHVLAAGSATGDAVDNLITGDLSIATLEDGLNRSAAWVSERGIKAELDLTQLVAHPYNRWDIHEILKSQLRSDTANNASNAFNQVGLQVVQSRYIAGTDDWFLTSGPNNHYGIVYWRQMPTVDHTIDFDTGNAKTKMEYALSVGFADWRGLVGSQG